MSFYTNNTSGLPFHTDGIIPVASEASFIPQSIPEVVSPATPGSFYYNRVESLRNTTGSPTPSQPHQTYESQRPFSRVTTEPGSAQTSDIDIEHGYNPKHQWQYAQPMDGTSQYNQPETGHSQTVQPQAGLSQNMSGNFDSKIEPAYHKPSQMTYASAPEQEPKKKGFWRGYFRVVKKLAGLSKSKGGMIWFCIANFISMIATALIISGCSSNLSSIFSIYVIGVDFDPLSLSTNQSGLIAIGISGSCLLSPQINSATKTVTFIKECQPQFVQELYNPHEKFNISRPSNSTPNSVGISRNGDPKALSLANTLMKLFAALLFILVFYNAANIVLSVLGFYQSHIWILCWIPFLFCFGILATFSAVIAKHAQGLGDISIALQFVGFWVQPQLYAGILLLLASLIFTGILANPAMLIWILAIGLIILSVEFIIFCYIFVLMAWCMCSFYGGLANRPDGYPGQVNGYDGTW